MKRTIAMTLSLFLAVAWPGLTACDPEETRITPGTETPAPDPVPAPDPEPSAGNRVRIGIGSVSYTATLADNATARAFADLLPLTLPMNELNGNEKYADLSTDLPTGASSPGTIRTGDLMLFGRNCVVLFYEAFSTSYSYTRIGSVDDPASLAAALGPGAVTVVVTRIE